MSRAISTPSSADHPSQKSTEDLRGELVPRIAFALVFATIAGLLWLGLAGKQAAIGRHIASLDSERRDLLERRVVALLDHAEATSPERLEARAEALGFVRHAPVVHVPVHDALALTGPSGVDEPLTISRRLAPVGGIALEPADVSSVLMGLGAAAPASANERAQEEDSSKR